MDWKRKTGLGIVLLLLTGFQWVQAQAVTVTGTVTDAVTHLPLQNVSVFFTGAQGIITDSAGKYRIESDLPVNYIEYSIVGYQSAKRRLSAGTLVVINVELTPSAKNLNNVTVTTNKRAKYRNKNNPAVELIRQVIAHKEDNRMQAYKSATYEKYEKIQLSLSKISKKITDSKLLKRYDFVFDNADTTKLEGHSITPVYLEETLSDIYYRKSPQQQKTVVKGRKKVDFGEFVDMVGVSSYLNRLYEDINIYDDNISILTNQFLSPIADLSPTFYMFYIRDTVEMNGEKLVKMYFTPRNPNDLLFRGTMFITLDGNYGIQQINMFVSSRVNLNFVRQLKIDQEFEKSQEGRYYLNKSDMLVDFGLSKNGGGLFGERVVSYKDFQTNIAIADSVFKGPQVALSDEKAEQRLDTFWVNHRHDTLSTAESKVYANIDSLRNMKSFRRLMDWGTFLLAGYKQAGPFEIGPANTFYSFNPVEGFRLRLGGRTTPNLSKRYYFETYGAYGFKDEKWKYFLSASYSLNNKSIYGYPLHYIRASYQRDTKIPGQELQFVQEDNFLLSFKRGNNDKWLYNDIFNFSYVREFGDHLRYSLGFKYWKQQPAGSIVYTKPTILGDINIDYIKTSELSAEFRWAPHEQFYQGKLYRVPIINRFPIFTFRYIAGIKGLFGSEYNYQNINLRIEKRFYLSQFGYTDITAEGGYLFGKVPFPLMTIHRANQTYSYQLASFNLMNFMEFVSDKYTSVSLDHYFNGFIFNKVPLLKRLKWREVIAGKILFGSTRDENNPEKTPDQIKFPTTNGVASTFVLDKQPYFEASVGITNIFKLLRLDFVKRFTYLQHADIPTWGIRGRVKFDF